MIFKIKFNKNLIIALIQFLIVNSVLAKPFSNPFEESIDPNCDEIIKHNNLIKFNEEDLQEVYGNRLEAYQDAVKLKRSPNKMRDSAAGRDKLDPWHDYYRYHLTLVTESTPDWDGIQKFYADTIKEVETTVDDPEYRKTYYDKKNNFRSLCPGGDYVNCTSIKAYCAEEVAKKTLAHKLVQYNEQKRSCTEHKSKNSTKKKELQKFIDDCDDALKNLEDLKEDIDKVAAIEKNKGTGEVANYFSQVYDELSKFKGSWAELRRNLSENLADFNDEELGIDDASLKEKDDKEKRDQYDKVKEELKECAKLSFSRDTDPNQGALISNLCTYAGASITDEELSNVNFSASEIDKLEKEMLEIQNQYMDQIIGELEETSFQMTLINAWSVQRPQPENTLEAINHICEPAPDLCKLINFKEIMFETFNTYQKNKHRSPIANLNDQKMENILNDTIIPRMKAMNAECSASLGYNDYYDNSPYKRKLDEKMNSNNTEGKAFNSKQPDSFYSEKPPLTFDEYLDNSIDSYGLLNLNGSPFDDTFRKEKKASATLAIYEQNAVELYNNDLGILLSTDVFKGNITEGKEGIGYYSKEKWQENCFSSDDEVGGTGKMFDLPLKLADLKNAFDEYSSNIYQETKRLNNEYKKSLVDPDPYIKQYLKTNPQTIVNMLQESLDPNFVKALCSYIISIEDWDYWKDFMKDGLTIAAAVNAVAGAVLSATPVAPLGWLALGVSSVLTAAEAAIIIADYKTNQEDERRLEQSISTGQADFEKEIDRILDLREKNEENINDLYWLAGSEAFNQLTGPLGYYSKFTKIPQLAKLKILGKVVRGAEKTVRVKTYLGTTKSWAEGIFNGLEKMDINRKSKHNDPSRPINNISTSSKSQLAFLYSRLDDQSANELNAELDKFVSPSEIEKFVKTYDQNMDRLIATGEVNMNLLKSFARDSKLNTLPSADKIEEYNK